MECIECPKPIHPERLAVNPRVKTCSATCSANRKRRHRSEAGTRCHQRQRAKAKAAGEALLKLSRYCHDKNYRHRSSNRRPCVSISLPVFPNHATAWRLARTDHPC